MKAKIYKSTGSWYVAKVATGEVWNARLKGVLKLDGFTSTNPIAVGDEVEMVAESADDRTAIITDVYDRDNYINRQSPSHKMQHHIVAANLDQSLLIATLKEPRTSQGFIDRFLVACEAYHVPAIIIFNKADLFRNKESEKFEEWREMYEAIGYRVVKMSVQTGEGVEAVREALAGKISLLSGHSGVGKSSFLNAIFPGLGLKTQALSGWSNKGQHTTTFAEMFDLPDGNGALIDTPGMKEFGLVDILRAELSGYFPEMRALAGQCQFNNCLHAEEPGCAVKEGVREGRISEDRYVSYRSILDSIDDKHY